MTSKIKLLVVLNIVLLSAVLFSLSSTNKSSTLSVKQGSFTLTDTLGINRIEVGENVLVKTGPSRWRVNDNYDVQPSRLQSLLAVLGRMEIKRPVPEASLDTVKNLIDNNSIGVKIFRDNEIVTQYELSGSGDETYARTASGNIPYIVYIPGYFVNIYELFNIDENEWRDKRVLYTTWRTLQSLDINYIGDPKNRLTVSFDSAFYKVEGITRLDSAKLYNYIQQYQDFEVDDYVEDNENLRNSLSESQPFCVVSLNDLYESRNNQLTIYPNDSTVYGISEKTGEIVQMNRGMLRNFLVSREEFRRSEKQ
ncbi:MAG: hypothetical protein CMO01_31165 [Thalassobius sp.]|nr:hypothetical protein [Thalassovita sp.]